MLVLAGLTLWTPRAGSAQTEADLAGTGRAEARGHAAEAAAHVDVPAVLHVEPAGTVRLRFAAPAGGRSPGERSVPVGCAGNVPHVLTVRRAGSADPGDVGVQWSADGGPWHTLSATAAPVGGALAPGRHRECAELRFRLRGGDEGPAGDRRVDVRLELRPLDEGA